jgi:small basic protein
MKFAPGDFVHSVKYNKVAKVIVVWQLSLIVVRVILFLGSRLGVSIRAAARQGFGIQPHGNAKYLRHCLLSLDDSA